MKGLGGDKWAVHHEGLRRAAAGEQLLFCSLGEPDFATPGAIVDVAERAMRAGRTRYSSGVGEPGVRAAIARRYSQRSGRPIEPEQVVYVPGTQTGMYLAMATLLDPGDEVLLPDPYYATYEGVIAAPGGVVHPVRLDPDNGFHLRADDLRAAIGPASRVLVLTTPSNPTGAVLTRDEMAAIGQVCIEHDLWIVCDEVYAELTFDGGFASPLDLPELAERTVVVSSLSKSHAMTGFRCGWIVSSPEFVERCEPVVEAMLFGSQQFLEDATEYALSRDFEECDAMRRAYASRARVVVDTLHEVAGLRCRMPEGGMFVMVDVRATGMSGEEFAWRLLDDQKVVVMPGESFGHGGAGHIRLGLVGSEAILREACERMCTFARRATITST